MRELVIDFGAGPAKASDGNGLLPWLGSHMVATASETTGSAGVTPAASAKSLASALRG